MIRYSKFLITMILLPLLFAISNTIQDSNETIGPQAAIGNQSVNPPIDNGTRLGPQDLNTDELTVTQEMIAQDLHNLSPAEIAVYPLNELSSKDLMMILNVLSVDDLEKLLINIELDKLREILIMKLSQENANQILSRLTDETNQEVLGRINATSP